MEPNQNQSDDRDIARRLAPLDHDAAPLDSAAIQRINRLAAEQFSAVDMKPAPNVPPHDDSPRRRRRMFTKIAAALVATACSIGLLFQLTDTTDGGETLGAMLQETLQAESLQLKVTRRGETAEVLVEPAGRVRWQESATSYRIAKGSRLWQIDEAANTVSQKTSPWYDSEAKQVDLLALLDIDGKQAAKFREATAEKVTVDGEAVRRYRLDTTSAGKPITIEAVADGQTGLLRSIVAWPRDRRSSPPLAELTLVARGGAVDEEKFAVAKSLSDDGRIGKIVDSQGIVGLRPGMSDRWTPVARQMLLKPGDWLRTDVRGANAATLTMTTGRKVITGPGSLLEISGPNRLKLSGGEIKIAGDKQAEGDLELIGPGEKTLSIPAKETAIYRVERGGELKKLAKAPRWLEYYEGNTTNDSIGSLIVQVDGRDVPLTVGYHKVNVEIRDQIARTTIEESFVNRTNGRLEGIFHFPLPQDASISGFGMWIDGELIEADVVEKQRAREIYETILRENRDPGLLEWTGGNIFKARVFPIPAHSEKRIKIVYTQVLPLRANQYRYSYGLRSEMLQTTPLRELSLSVLINSELPIKSVHSPTHDVRAQNTEHSAKLDFVAQEYTPERDFEVVCELDSAGSDVVVVPHRRGDDGYFMVQLTPPSAEGNWQREIVPDGQPLEVLLVCDTSASIDSANRQQQAEFVASLLTSLGPKDRFNLAVADVNTRWLHDNHVVANDQNIEQARTHLADRISLGWTDLDRMVESILPRLNDHTHVVYVGDGIVTAHDADPQAFANRLNRLTAKNRTGTFHAISLGSSYESTVLKAIARVGGGSMRQIGGEQTPQQTAFELLNEIAQPGLRDLKVEFRGVEVAAVYPQQLPNLAAGTQQILIGRYLPQGEQQSGQIVISGERNGEPVRFTANITLAAAEAGNSFIPRLWARAHLDQLLEQGSSQAIQDEIIAMSEEFHIITPYTSLLVLESDADRERFNVKRRYEMRDGERFFADGKANANYELLQQQMKRAGDWRLALRRRILSQFSQLGRSTQLFQQQQRVSTFNTVLASGPFSGAIPSSKPMAANNREVYLDGLEANLGDVRLGLDYDGDAQGFKNLRELSSLKDLDKTISMRSDDVMWDMELAESDRRFPGQEMFERSKRELGYSFDESPNMSGEPLGEQLFAQSLTPLAQQPQHAKETFALGGAFGSRGPAGWTSYGRGEAAARYNNGYLNWLNTLFPEIPPPSTQASQQESNWPEEAVALSRSLKQPLQLEAGGIEVDLQYEHVDPIWDRVNNRSLQHQLYGADRWLNYVHTHSSPTVVYWCDAKQRGAYSRAFQLGRVREREDGDYAALTPGNRPRSEGLLHQTYRNYHASIEKQGENRVVLVLSSKQDEVSPSHPQLRITIDTQRHIVLEDTWTNGEQNTSATRYSEHFQVAGVWWPGKSETFNAEEQLTMQMTQQVKLHAAEPFEKQLQAELPGDEVLLLELPTPSIREAEKQVAAGGGSVEAHLMLLIGASMIQKWDDVLTHLTAIEELSPNKPGLIWVRAAVFMAARENEQARQLLQEQADKLVDQPTADDYALARYILTQTQSIIDQNERLRLLDRLRPVFERQAEEVAAMHSWKSQRVGALRALGRTEEVLPLQLELAKSTPWDISAQTTYANDLKTAGELDKAYDWLRKQIDLKPERSPYQTDQLRGAYADMLRKQGRADELVDFLREWVEASPPQSSAYEQYLAALIMADQVEQADATALRWLNESRVEQKLNESQAARLYSAISFALGQRYQQYMNYMEPKWYEPLRETALFFLEHEHQFDIATRIISDHRFRDSDQADRLIDEIGERLQEHVQTLDATRVASYVSWSSGSSELTKDDWQQIAKTLRGRWNTEQDLTKLHGLGGALLQVYSTHFPDSLQLPFLRERIERANEREEPTYAASFSLALLNELLSRDWQDAYEAEALDLIEHVSAAEDVGQRVFEQIGVLHRFVDRMLEARYQAALKQLQALDHPEELTRTELAEKQAEFHEAARAGVVARLNEYLDEQPGAPRPPDAETGRGELLQWIALEQMYLELRLDQNEKQIISQLWSMLGDQPPLVNDEEESAEENEQKQLTSASRQRIEVLRKQRAFAMLNYLAVRRSAPESLVKRLESYLGAGLDQQGDAAAPWKAARYALLIALDRPDELELELRKWIAAEEHPAAWQLALARLVAERGKIEEAITLMEAVEKTSQLSPADYAMLADWYLVADKRAKYERSKIEVFKVWPEYQINNWLRQQRQPWQRTDQPVPSELNEDVLFAFQALFEKSNRPESYTYELREFYTASRDFRLLNMLPDAVTGRTPQQVYSLLKGLKSSVMQEIRKEATADEILARIDELRRRDLTALDLRALDLLESLVERQASEVLNQPGPHIEAAVAALRRAFEREWAEGEVRQMAEFLRDLGTITQDDLKAERIRQLRALHGMTQPGTDDRLFVAWHLAHAQFYSHADHVGGAAVMENALREFDQTHPDGWPAHANDPLDGYVNMLEYDNQFAAAERVLNRYLEEPLNDTQGYWLLQRRDQTYREALREDGQVSLGSGATLYANLHEHLLTRLKETTDDRHRYDTINTLLRVYHVAEDKHIDAYRDDLSDFAFKLLPKLMERQQLNYSNILGQVADALKELVSVREALRFVIIQYENYPPRYQYTWNNAWRELSYRLSDYAKQLKGELGDLEPRLLKIVLDELRRDLRTQHSNNHYFYHRNYGNYYWEEKEADFLRVAEEVLAERKDSGRAVTYIAKYMYHGLYKYERAIEIMLIAHGKGLLDDAQQIVLVEYLHARDRYAESIPILEPLIERKPDQITYRTRLMVAYYQAQRPEQLQKLLTSTDEHFRTAELWNESTLYQLAETTLNVKRFNESVAYYEELIALHQRTAANRGIAGGTLSRYYGQLAQAYSALGKTEQAVDAAAAGIVAWGPRHDQRQSAISWLHQVLSDAKDLDAYVKLRDQQAEQTGQDSPLIRQQIGRVYSSRGKHNEAIEQYQIALKLQPNDLETHRQLIASYKAVDNQQAVIKQSLALLDLDRHNLQLYKDLAQQLKADEALAERAATTLVEAAPNEAAHHQALAELRQQQDRWPEAIEHWQHVARLRSLEPTGLLELAQAQLHEKRYEEVERTLDKLRNTDWPSRFGNVRSQVDNLQRQIPEPK